MKHHNLRILIILLVLFSASYLHAAINFDQQISACDAAKSEILRNTAENSSYSILENRYYKTISRLSKDFNRNRYYSPALGRFISKDPIGFNGGFNLWRYADNNPIIYTDPTGNIAWAPALLNPANWLLLAAFIEGLRAIHNTDVKCDTSGDDDYDFDDANRPCKESEMTPVLILIVPPGAAGHFEYGHASLLSTAGVRGWWPTPEATINNLFGLGRVRDDTMTATRFSEPGRGYRACPESQKKIVEMIELSLTPKNWLFDLHNTKGRNCAGWVGQVLQGAGFSPPMPPATPDLSPLLLK